MLDGGAPDTDPEAEQVQLELLRRAGPERRARMALGLSAQVITLARRDLLDRALDDSMSKS